MLSAAGFTRERRLEVKSYNQVFVRDDARACIAPVKPSSRPLAEDSGKRMSKKPHWLNPLPWVWSDALDEWGGDRHRATVFGRRRDGPTAAQRWWRPGDGGHR